MNIAHIGSGYWGRNLIRNFHQIGALQVICDSDPEKLEEIRRQHKDLKVETNASKIFSDPDIAGVSIATPAETHFSLVEEALQSGKHVFVEKPLSLKASEGRKLVALAKEKKKILMVGHLLHYHPAVVTLKSLVEAGELGKLEYIYSNRVNLGKIRTEENILWSFAPHDISIILSLVGALPVQVNSVGGNYLQPNIPDTTISTFLFENGVRAHIYVSWLHPFKEQRMVIMGSKKMLVFDDRAQVERKLLMYDKNVEIQDGQFIVQKPEGVPIPFEKDQEPLRAECEHFIHCIETGESPLTNGDEGVRVLSVLQGCQKSLEMNGQPVQIQEN